MTGALLANDPDAHVCLTCSPAGTDNKALGALGILGYGFHFGARAGRASIFLRCSMAWTNVFRRFTSIWRADPARVY